QRSAGLRQRAGREAGLNQNGAEADTGQQAQLSKSHESLPRLGWQKTWMAYQSCRDLHANPSFATDRNSRESSRGGMTCPLGGRAACTPVGSIGPGIGCRKRVSAGFHVLWRDACSSTTRGYFRVFAVNRIWPCSAYELPTLGCSLCSMADPDP